MLGKLVKITKEGNKIRLYLRTRNGKVKVYVDDFYPYFYVPDPNGQYMAVDGTKVRKIYVNDPSDVPELRERYKVHYEADIPYVRRFLIDTGVKSYVDVPSLTTSWKNVRPAEPAELIPLRIWFIDIEVKANTLPNPQNPEFPIHAITVYDTYLNKYITLAVANESKVINDDKWIRVLYENEMKMLNSFAELTNKLDSDILVAWNVEFDYTYIINRYIKLGLKPPFDGADIFDLLTGYKELYKRKSYRLKSVAFEEGLITEEEAKASYDPNMPLEQLLEYNKRDVEIMVKLDERYKLIDFYLALKEFVGLPSLMDISSSVLIDTELLRLARERGVVLPSRREAENEGYEGAVVFEPPAGIYENVAVFDMTTYYPSIIISFNISPDTISPDGEIKYGNVAFKRTPGLLPELCKRFLALRKLIETEMTKYDPNSPKYHELKTKRDAVKYLVNAIYGYTAFEKSRIFDIRLASTITAIGREGLIKTKELASAKGYNVLYGDTDSVMIQVPFDKAQELIEYLNEEIRKYFKEKYGVSNVQIGLKFEVYADKVMFFGVKKRYVAHIVWEKGKQVDYFKYVGIEAVRSDEPKFAQEFQKGLVELVLRGATKEQVMEYINKAREELKVRPLIDIALNEGIQKPLDKYKNRPPHIRAALYSNMYLGTNFKHGDRIYWLWVKGVKGYPPTDVVAFDVDTKLPELIIDWDKMEEVNIWQKAEPILEILKIAAPKVSSDSLDLRRWFK
jgi:DNA polymerase I